MLRQLSGFKYAMETDLIMDYHHILLDLEAHKLCATILPCGANTNTKGYQWVWKQTQTYSKGSCMNY
jgi:hypothetical protein